MNAHPILFSAPMVQALLKGHKTQTRRIMSPQPSGGECRQLHEVVWGDAAEKLSGRDRRTRAWAGFTDRRAPGSVAYYGSRYGIPGDLLWVRETWQEFFADEVQVWRRDAPAARMGIPAQPDRKAIVAYRADGEIVPHPEYGKALWRPSSYMPRWASRLTLRITDVRVERVQDISEKDAIAEGVWGTFVEDGRYWRNYSLSDEDAACSPMLNFPTESYRTLWESIYGADSWRANPWVWALTFEVIRANVDAVLAERAAA